MKKIVNDYLPSSGYTAMTVWPLLFVRRDLQHKFNAAALRHERIHARQQLEMLILPFYLWYGLEWLVRAFCYGSNAVAYRRLSFEQEAYNHQQEEAYLQRRRPFAWLRYVLRK